MTKTQKDKYGEKVPQDLITFSEVSDLITSEKLGKVTNLDWYEIWTSPRNNSIFVSQTALEKELDIILDGRDCSPEAIGLKGDVMKIHDVLKRWSQEDGFYHV